MTSDDLLDYGCVNCSDPESLHRKSDHRVTVPAAAFEPGTEVWECTKPDCPCVRFERALTIHTSARPKERS